MIQSVRSIQRTQRLVVEGYAPLSLNAVIEMCKRHWSQYAMEKRRRTETVAWLAKAERMKPVLVPPAIRIWYYVRDRKMEKDNLLVNDKWLLDGLCQAGILPDDRWDNYTDLDHRFRIDRARPRVEVELVEVDRTEQDGLDS